MSVLEIVFVGQCEVFVCLDFVLNFFFSPLAAKLVGLRMGCQFFKNVDFSDTYLHKRNSLRKFSALSTIRRYSHHQNKVKSLGRNSSY